MGTLNELKQKVKEFEKKAGFDKTEIKKLLEMLQKEVDILKSNSDNKEIASHELMDLQVLILQLANRFDTDLDSEWEKHFEKSNKYLE